MNHEASHPTAPAHTAAGHPRFMPGQILATPEALRTMQQHGCSPLELLQRHLHGDWGDLHPDDAALNDAAVFDGSRIFSSYRIAEGVVVWLITEACDGDGKRLSSTYLLPDEY